MQCIIETWGLIRRLKHLSMEAKLSLQLIKTFTKYDHGIATTNYQNKRWFELYELGDSICDFCEAEKFSVQVYWKLFPIPLGAE